MKVIYVFLLFLYKSIPIALGQFAPAVGQPGTSAIYKDSSIFVNWAKDCSIIRGYQNISDPSFGSASAGVETMATGKSGTNGTVSLGDGGMAVLSFTSPIINGPGWDFAVFENAFDDYFLELAFVEVSSDGSNFYRFPAISLTDTLSQINSFDSLDATKLNNLAGKYRLFYGTPFDLEEMTNIPGLDVNYITHVKIIDVVGNINDQYASRDIQNNKVNDPWPTAFPSGGFDLDAVGVINQAVVSRLLEKLDHPFNFSPYPNPAKEMLSIRYKLNDCSWIKIKLTDLSGADILVEEIYNCAGDYTATVNTSTLRNGLYFLQLFNEQNKAQQKIMIQK